jgi:peptidoglycan/xylan/chitin deacetylase (PgdA/CDA1 family)
MARAAVKRLARWCVAEIGRRAASGRTAPLRAVTYHRLTADANARSSAGVRRADFRRQIAFIRAECRSLAPGELPKLAGAASARPLICVTIDDGHISGFDIAAPILAEHAVPALFFVPTGSIGQRQYFARTHLRQLCEAGFAIGSHGCSHRSLAALAPVDQLREARRSKEILEDLTGREVFAFAYPFGTVRDFGAASERAVASAGYRLAFTAQHGPITARTPRLRLPRIKIEGTDSCRLFESLVHGALDGWRYVDRWGWWLQRGAHRRAAVVKPGWSDA